MALRFQLINDKVGSIVLDKADPIDINSIKRTVKRSELYEGVVYQIVLDVEFIKEGRWFIKQCYETDGGIDCVTIVNIYRRDPNKRRWKLYATGQINYNRWELSEESVVVNIEQTGVERRVLNLIETSVDLQTNTSIGGTPLPAQTIYTVPFHSKTILKELYLTPSSEDLFQSTDEFLIHIPQTSPPIGDRDTYPGFGYAVGQIDFTNLSVNDLDGGEAVPYEITTLQLPPGIIGDGVSIGTVQGYTDVLNSNLNGREPIYQALESGTLDIHIRVRLKPAVYSIRVGGDVDICGEGHLGYFEVRAWLEKRNIDNQVIYIEPMGTMWTIPGCGGEERIGNFTTKNKDIVGEAVEVGDKYYVYVTFRVYGSYETPRETDFGGDGYLYHTFTIQADLSNTYIQFLNRTTFPSTNVKTLFLYDAFERCVQYYTNQIDCFRSNLLGRVERGYAQDGEGAMMCLTNGYWLRGLTGKNIFADLKELVDFANTVFCVGFGFEMVDGKQVFRLEKREYFYNKSVTVVSLGKVYDIKREVDAKKFYNQIEYGYSSKIEVGQANAIDEFNTLRRHSIPITNTKNNLKVSSSMKVSGYQIEEQRRLTGSTIDSKFDDSNFAVVLIRDGVSFRTKRNEGYDIIGNVFDPSSGYNYDLRPSKTLRNWFKIIKSSLIRSTDKTIKFTFGEVNYTMVTKETNDVSNVSENGNFDLSNVEAITDNEVYRFSSKLTADQMELIVQDPYSVIKFEDRFGNQLEGFISEEGIEHDENKNIAEFTLRRVFRPTAI